MADKNKDEGKRPIIIKKIKKGGHGHHGGAWKVAYADFVTAMMAFFLLLWLLSTSSKSKLEGLAEYFTPTTGVKDSMGIGFKGGQADSKEGQMKNVLMSPGLVAGRTPAGTVNDTPENSAKSDSNQDANLFKQGASALEQSFKKDVKLNRYGDNISIQQTPEGLKIDIKDSDKYGMFEPGTAKLTADGQAILAGIAPLLKKLPNFMSITGHTDASPTESGHADYGNWELSSDRAQAARRFLIKSGIEEERPTKVVGMADRDLFSPTEPRSPSNRRVTLLMLRGSHILVPDAAMHGVGAEQPDKKAEPAPKPAEGAAAPAADAPAK